MPTFQHQDIEVFYREAGEGEPLLLGHSSTGSSAQWRTFLESAARHHRVVAPDHIGYGRSGPYRGARSLLAQELGILESLLVGLGAPTHLVGHSYGGHLLTRLALRHPDRVRSLTLIEPTLFFLLAEHGREAEYEEIRLVADRLDLDVAEGDPERAARGFIDYWVGQGAYDAMEPRVRDSVSAAIGKVVVEWPSSFEPRGVGPRTLARLDMPALLLVGTRTTSPARGVVELLGTMLPDARVVEIPGAGHMGPVTHAALYEAAIAEFLASLRGER
ncbi:MAG: alpha/beta hydrolase [Ectothiorhodospiraceae bacterium]|nr:alpha/beta hydrolase [Chromatiales bacterium]MCP5154017.1 alpha/beta hydrolase [Ectothiorhodospiraceae bacterium]